MNIEITVIVIALLLAVLAAIADAASAAFAKALETLRYSGAAKDKKVDESIDIESRGKIERFFEGKPEKVGAAVGTARRVFFAITIFCFYILVVKIFVAFGVELSNAQKLLVFVVTLPFEIALIRVFFEIPFFAYAARFPRKTIYRLSKYFAIIYLFARPFDILMSKLAIKIFGEKSGNPRPLDYIDVELRLRAENVEADSISPYAGKIVKNALRLGELDVSDVMVPRSEIAFLNTEDSFEENLAKVKRYRYTRFPISKGALDECLGLVHVKAIFSSEPKSNGDLLAMRRDAMRVREGESLETALAKMLKYRIHMALVEDEFGGIIGALTLDKALGELVGEIRDEMDISEASAIRAVGKNLYKISGKASLHKVEDFLGVDFNNDGVSTFGGLITNMLGRFPEKGEKIRFVSQRMSVTIDNVRPRGIEECTVSVEESIGEH